jgi:hypothetical protein
MMAERVCIDCGKTLPETSVYVCSSCLGKRRVKDRDGRAHQATVAHLAVFVKPNGYMRIVDLNVKSASDLVCQGHATCKLYHSEVALKLYPYKMYYDCIISDTVLLESHWKYNLPAMHILNVLEGFHPESTRSVCGSAVICGPNGTSLYPEEAQTIIHSFER